MPGKDHPVDDIAAAILDGTPIDWSAAEAHATPEERALIEELRLLSTLAEVHRHPPSETGRQDGPLEDRLHATAAELNTERRARYRRAARGSAWILLAGVAVILAVGWRRWTTPR